MSEEQKEVKQEGETTPTGSSPEQKPLSEKSSVKTTGDRQLTPQEQEEWDNQPDGVTKDGKVIKKSGNEDEGNVNIEQQAEKSPEINALENEKKRLKDLINEKREKKLAEINELRVEKRKIDSDENIEDLGDDLDGWNKVNERIELTIDDRLNRQEFYSSYPDFFNGNEGLKNRELIETIVKREFKTPTNNARQMVFNDVFGDLLKDGESNLDRQYAIKKQIETDAATLGSVRGTTASSPVRKQHKRLFPKDESPKDWYPVKKE